MKKGFTLIELLVVVLIIGILAAIALPMYTKAVEKTRAAEALLLVKSLEEAMQRYTLEQGFVEVDSEVLAESLDVNLGEWEDGFGFVTKHFFYMPSTGTNAYYIQVGRYMDEPGNDMYNLEIEIFPDQASANARAQELGDEVDQVGGAAFKPSGNVIKYCNPNVKKANDICSGLRSSGYNVVYWAE